jgi:phosphinothricin acetyltransferase
MLDQPLPVVVRPSTEQDVPFMVDIYAYHVQNGLGDYQPDPLHPEDIKRRRKAMLKRRLPHIVADFNGAIIGYAYAVPFLKRPSYRYAVKHSIYVHKDHRQSGVGRKLLPALIEACAAAGYRQMICYIDGENAPSLSLHEGFGFARAGVLKSVAFRFGRWTDTVLLQRPLGEGDASLPGRLESVAEEAGSQNPPQYSH